MLMIRGGGDPPKEIRPVEPPVYLQKKINPDN